MKLRQFTVGLWILLMSYNAIHLIRLLGQSTVNSWAEVAAAKESRGHTERVCDSVCVYAQSK